MVDAAEDRRWRIKVRSSELRWDEWLARHNRRRMLELLVGLPAILGVAFINGALAAGWFTQDVWMTTGMVVLLLVFMTLQLWPGPHQRHELEFDAEANKQIDAEDKLARQAAEWVQRGPVH